MADQDKDLPLVVSEILVEMHGMNTRLERVENVLSQVVGSIQHLSGAVSRMAEVINKQQEANTANFKLLMQADERNTIRLEAALNQINQRLEYLENK
ncbi:MAG TPA: hypothetical protein VFO93_22190 [Hymenobacter sp.]|uniref:hypothetical protein n=1 Tax=Hymenobacter sp. TaxID=1898978 RepID=UPI002D7E83E5|nr:hypothetical protein [Hymenobacter sp.]HET9506266.1 hypothetical protein [Hymenobacter sp.]